MKLKPTIIEENVFKQEDIAMINDYVREHGKKVPRIHEWEGPTQGKLISESYFLSFCLSFPPYATAHQHQGCEEDH